MPIDEKLFKSLKEGFEYLEEYDKLGGRPDKRVPLCISVTLHLKKELEAQGKGHISRFVERTLEQNLHKRN